MPEERRRFFRIDDSMRVAYRCLGSEEARVFARQAREQGGNFDYAANFDNRIQTLLDACRVQAPIAAEVLDLLNKKLNFIVQQLDIDNGLMQSIAYTMKPVNISACGMAFAVTEKLPAGQAVQLDMLLHPSELHVMTMARVIACEPIDNTEAGAVDEQGEQQYFLRLDFVEINNTDQELLIQHIVKRQSALFKQQKSNSE